MTMLLLDRLAVIEPGHGLYYHTDNVMLSCTVRFTNTCVSVVNSHGIELPKPRFMLLIGGFYIW